MNKDRDEIREEVREELDDAGIFIVHASKVQKQKYFDVLEDMRDRGEVRRGDEVEDQSFTYPMNVYVP